MLSEVAVGSGVIEQRLVELLPVCQVAAQVEKPCQRADKLPGQMRRDIRGGSGLLRGSDKVGTLDLEPLKRLVEVVEGEGSLVAMDVRHKLFCSYVPVCLPSGRQHPVEGAGQRCHGGSSRSSCSPPWPPCGESSDRRAPASPPWSFSSQAQLSWWPASSPAGSCTGSTR